MKLKQYVQCVKVTLQERPGELWPDRDPCQSFSGPLGPLVWPGVRLLSLLSKASGHQCLTDAFQWSLFPFPIRVSGNFTSVLLAAAFKCADIFKWVLHAQVTLESHGQIIKAHSFSFLCSLVHSFIIQTNTDRAKYSESPGLGTLLNCLQFLLEHTLYRIDQISGQGRLP